MHMECDIMIEIFTVFLAGIFEVYHIKNDTLATADILCWYSTADRLFMLCG